MKQKSEKRKVRRKGCFVPVEAKKGAAFEKVQTVDISRGGIGFVSSRRIPVKKRIAVELELDPNDQPVLVIGEVRWARKILKTDYFRVGMKFAKIMEGSKTRLKKMPCK